MQLTEVKSNKRKKKNLMKFKNQGSKNECISEVRWQLEFQGETNGNFSNLMTNRNSYICTIFFFKMFSSGGYSDNRSQSGKRFAKQVPH